MLFEVVMILGVAFSPEKVAEMKKTGNGIAGITNDANQTVQSIKLTNILKAFLAASNENLVIMR